MASFRNMYFPLVAIFFFAYLMTEANATITYGCFPNGTIKVQNPDKTHFVYALAFDFELIGTELADASKILCDLGFNDDKSVITIRQNTIGNCRRDHYIQLSVSSKPLSEEIIVREEEDTVNFRLRCVEVPEEGVTVTVVQEFDPILALFDLPPEDMEPGVLPNFSRSVQSAMRRCCDPTHPPIRSANVGDHLYWTLDVYYDFFLFPVQCDAYAGLSTLGEPKMTLYHRGCSLDPSLTDYNMNLTYNTTKIRMYVMDFFVFHFYNSKYITIQCTIKICGQGNKEACEWGGACNDLKKRSTSLDSTAASREVLAKTEMTLQVIGYPSSAHRALSLTIVGVILVVATLLVDH